MSELRSVQVWLVAWDTGGAVKFNAQVVSVHLNAEEAVLTPIGTPGIAADPVLLTKFSHAVAYN